MDSPRSITSRAGAMSDDGRARPFDTLRTRANIYPRLNTLAEQAKKKRLEKTSEALQVVTRRKSEVKETTDKRSEELVAFGRRSTHIPHTPPPSMPTQIPTLQPRTTCTNRNPVQNFSSGSLYSFSSGTNAQSFSSGNHQRSISREEEAANRESSKEQKDSNAAASLHGNVSEGDVKVLTLDMSQTSTYLARRNMSPITGTTPYIHEPPQPHQKDASDDIRFNKIQETLQLITDRMGKMENRVQLQEKMQADSMDTLTALTTNQIAFRDQLQSLTQRQEAKLQDLNDKQELRWQQMNDKQEKGFETLTSLIKSMNVNTTPEQERQTVVRTESRGEPRTTESNTETPRSNDQRSVISVAGTENERTTVEQGCNTSPRQGSQQNTNFFSQHKADKPEKFDGKVKNNALEKWIQFVENYATATRMNEADMLLFAISNLKEQAADWWLASSITQKERGEFITTFSQMKTAMRLYFADHATKCDAISKLRVLQEKMSVTGYTQEFLRLRLLCPEISEEIATQYYVEGLSTDIRAHVALHKPNKVDEAVNFAVVAATAIRRGNSYERTKPSNDRRNKNRFKSNVSNNVAETNTYKGNQKRLAMKTDDQARRKTCHFCKKPGHLMADCRKKAAQDKNAVDKKQRPIRKNNMQLDAESDSCNENLNDSDDDDEDCTALKVKCLAYEDVQSDESKPITSTAYETNRAMPNKLITLIAHINGRKARILVDPGAGDNFISEEFAKIFRIRKSKLSKPIKIQYADKRKDDCTHEVKNAQITIGNYNAYLPLIVAPLAYDAILGKPWLTREYPEIDWTTNKVWVIKENTRIPLPISNVHAILLRPVSLIRFQKEIYEHGTRTILITIRIRKNAQIRAQLLQSPKWRKRS